MINALSKDALFSIQSLKAADDEALTGAVVDTKGHKGVCFYVIALQGEALSFSIKAQQGAAANMSDAADLLGSSVAFTTGASADGQAVLDIKEPRERYVRAVVTVPDAAAATPTACIAVLYGGDVLPESNTNAEIHVNPAEGTA